MNEHVKEEIIRYLIDKTPLILDMNSMNIVYDPRDIHYKIYRYIKELQDEINKLKRL